MPLPNPPDDFPLPDFSLPFDADGALTPPPSFFPWETAANPKATVDDNLPDWLTPAPATVTPKPVADFFALPVPETPADDLLATLGLGLPAPMPVLEPAPTPVPQAVTDLHDDELTAPAEELDELFAVDTASTQEKFDIQHDWASSGKSLSYREAEDLFIVFTLGSTEYAVELSNIVEVSPKLHFAPLPFVPEWLLGLTNLRGDIVSVVDLRLFFGFTPKHGRDERLIVVRHDSGTTTGLLVDSIRGMRRIPTSANRAHIEGLETPVAPYLREIIDHDNRLLAVFDIPRLLDAEEFQELHAEAVA
jgi:purine-binding chemotaxis protein CheW